MPFQIQLILNVLLQIAPPWKPNIANDLDLRNIDQDFVNEPVPGSVMHHSVDVISVNVSDAFQGFSYNAAADETLLSQ